ncbi:hypothetical protein ACRS2Y_15860 [Pseudomonas putida]
MTSNTLRAVSAGKDRIIGLWRHPQSGKFAELYSVAREARNHVEGLQIAQMNINSNARLSDSAKREDGYTAAKQRLVFLGQLQRKLDDLRAAHERQIASMSAVQPYRDGDSSSVQIDLALAAQLRAMTPAERNAVLVTGTEKAYTQAALRLPRELTGLSADWHARIQKEALVRANPHEAQEAEDLLQAIDDTQDALRNSFGIIVADSGISLDDRVGAAGESAQNLVAGVNPIAIERIQERLAAQDDEYAASEQRIRQQLEGQA